MGCRKCQWEQSFFVLSFYFWSVLLFPKEEAQITFTSSIYAEHLLLICLTLRWPWKTFWLKTLKLLHSFPFFFSSLSPDAQPTEAEQETWEEVDVVLKDALGILDELQAYKGAGQEIREVWHELVILRKRQWNFTFPSECKYSQRIRWKEQYLRFKTSHILCLCNWNSVFCSITLHYKCQGDWCCYHGYCCYTETVAMERRLVQNESECFWFPFFIHSKGYGTFLFMKKHSNYFNEAHLFENWRAHWGTKGKHWLDVLSSVRVERKMNKPKNHP